MSDTLEVSADRLAARPRSPSPAQLRAARTMLDWSMADLAEAALLSPATIKRMEMGQPQPVSAVAYLKVCAALTMAGVRFLPDDGQGEGVRLGRKR